MTFDLRGVTVVLLPGTGSDDDYLDRVFSGPLQQVGAVLTVHRPQPQRLIDGYLAALDTAAVQHGPIAVGGVSIGAAVALGWALRHPDKVVAVLAALPAWTGSPDEAPAAQAARHSAQQLRRDGLAAVVAQLHASSPAWLAGELARSWADQWPHLPEAMEAAADFVAPGLAELRTLAVPLAVAAATDDPVHPLPIAAEWVAAAPRAALRTVTLDQIGAEPATLGAACLAALTDASRG
ncbi:MAG TPA: alpha/beta hydrolase [Mycobacterium sp.]|nr:alpha/beta hydrolase [Mycobacterium sp.]